MSRPINTEAWKFSLEVLEAKDVNDSRFDAVVIVTHSVDALYKHPSLKHIAPYVDGFAKIHKGIGSAGSTIIPCENIHSKRIILASTGPVGGDFDDVRHYRDAGMAAGKCCGALSPLLIVIPHPRFPNAYLLAITGLLHSFYVPLNVREEEWPLKASKADLIGFHNLDGDVKVEAFLKEVSAIQAASNLCRDIGDGDPQRMAPPRVAEYVQHAFKGSPTIKVRITDDVETIKREYPLVSAVNRSANAVEAHRARLIWLEYSNTEGGEGEKAQETLMIVGKGVTIDTGGTDVKTGGHMFGMSRDKYGSAVVAGFFKALEVLRPKGLKVLGCMAMVRNSVGADSYTCDEIITCRSGKRVHIYNTDAEGRIAMVEPLSEFVELAAKEKNPPHLMTIATLTGHAVLTYGHCPAIMENGPSRAEHYGHHLQKTADAYGQPVELSRLHKEDFAFHASQSEGADLRQANTSPSVQTLRGHMTPAAFLIQGSRLDEHGCDSKHPLKYTHLDIGVSMGCYPDTSFPSPLLALIAQ